MKYRTFVKLRAGVPLTLVAGSVAGVVATGSGGTTTTTTVVRAPTKAFVATTRPSSPTTARSTSSATPPSQPGRGELSAIDREVLRLRDRPITDGSNDGTSAKYRSKVGGTVIELRADTGKGAAVWNRAKIDLDGDKLFDEKWDFNGDGTVVRKVAPNDDEVYSDTYRLTNKRWVLASRTVAATATTVIGLETGPGALRPIDRDVLRLQKEPLTNGTSDGTSLKWRVKQGQAVIELRSDSAKGSTTWNRVKLDLDGDKHIDEKWSIRPDGSVDRQVSPADDDKYTETYRLEGARWVKS